MTSPPETRCRRPTCVFTFLFCGLFLAPAIEAVQRDPHQQTYLETLRQYGIEPSAAGARRYLRKLLPQGDQQQQIDRLIEQLGDDEFVRREAATAQLLRMPTIPIDSLNKAAGGGNPEIRWRARAILEQAENQSAHVMLAALKVASSEKGQGLVRDILAIVPLCRRPFLRDAAHEALRAVATADDVDVLEAALDSDVAAVRIAATIGLTGAMAPNQTRQLHRLLDDRDDRVSLEAARGIGNLGDRASLPALVRLLGADDVQVRGESIAMLQGLTGETQGFANHSPQAERSEAIARWQDWLQDEAPTARLQFPVRRRRGGRGSLNGNTLVATGSARRVFELNPSGTEVWHYNGIDAWSAEKLPNGNVLIASYSDHKVIEVDAEGKVVWSLESVGAISAMTAKPLASGNILVADFTGRRVVEFARDRHVVWEHKTPDECFDADRLANGNTIIGCPNVIQEVAPDHTVVHEWPVSGRLNGFCALPNGNVIVANYGANTVYEMKPDGSTAWELSEPQPCDVFQLPDGGLLVATASRVVEVSADHKVVREICKAQYGSARR